MGIHEAHMAFGDWDIELTEDIPQEILDVLTSETSGFLGHMIITPTELDLREVDPLSVARYTGVMRSREFTEARRTIGGSGLVYWLGDQDKRGPINETVQNLNAVSFTAAVNAVLPPGITAGNIVAEIGTQSFSFLFATARYRLERICGAWEAEYDINPQGQLNAGTPASLYPTFNNPTTFIKRKGAGADPLWKHLPLASAALGADAVDFATRKLLVQSVDDIPRIAGEADQATSKRDLQGSLVAITDVSGESGTEAANADARAAALLAQLSQTRNSVRLSTAEYDVDGTVKLGDSIYVWDPEAGLFDMANEVNYRGETYWPAKLRVLGLNWPLTLNADGSKPGVYFREPTMSGTLWNLTPYIAWQNGGSTEVVVGALARSLVPESSEPLGPIVAPVVNPDSPPGIPDPPQVFGDERHLFVVVPTTTGGVAQPLSVTKMKVYASTTTGFTPGPTNYIGDIPVSRGNILLGQTVKGRFPWMEDALTYVRVSGLNSQEGPASTEVSDAATLIPSAAILSLVADKIDAGTISASISIMSPTITGGILQTAAAGQRVAMEEGEADRFKLYTGDAAEVAAANVRSVVAGSGGTRQLNLILTNPRISGETHASQFASFSPSQDLTTFETSVEMRTFLNATGALTSSVIVQPTAITAWIGSPTTGRRFFALSNGLGLRYGNASTEPAVTLGAGGVLASYGTTSQPSLAVGNTFAQLGVSDAGRRLRIDGTKYNFIGGDNASRFDILDDQINFWRGVGMNGWSIGFVGAGSVQRLSTGTNPGLFGDQVRISSTLDNVQIRVGGFAGDEADCVDNTGVGAYRVFKADVVDMCDEALKDEVGPAPWVLDDILQMPLAMQVRKVGKSRPVLGFAANKAPSYLTEDSTIFTGEGAKRRPMQGSKPNAGVAFAVAGIQNLNQRLEERLAKLEARLEKVKA